MNVRIREFVRRAGSASLDPNPVYRYGLAAAVVAAALVVRLVLYPVLGEHAPYLPFTLAIIVAARFGGRGPGLAATVLSAFGINWYILPPYYSLGVENPGAEAGLALFEAVGVVISLLVGHLRESLRSIAQAEEALRGQAELVSLSHDAIITMDPGRRIKEWNAGAEEMYGWTKAEATGKVLPELLEARGEKSVGEIDEILRNRQRWEGELCKVARDGRRLSVESSQVLLRDKWNQPAGILEIGRDITQRKRAEEALRVSEAQFRTLANAIPHLAWMANADGWIFWYNQRWYEYTGTTPEQMEGWGWQSVHDPGTLPEVLERWKGSIANGEPFDMVYPLRGADGVFRPFLTRVMPVRDSDGTIVRWFGTNTDISEQRNTERELRDALEQRKLALDAANMGSWDYRFDAGNVLRDEGFRRIYGVAPGTEVDFDALLALIHPEDRATVEKAVEQALAGVNDGEYRAEYRVVWPDGSVHAVAAHGRAFLEGTGAHRCAVRFAGVSMDITERRRAEAQLRQMQKLESIAVLAGGVAHDFNNLLTVIMGSASSALAECPTCQHSQAILSASERAAYLTKQLMAYAGKGQTLARVVDLSEVVSRSSGLLVASVPKRVILRFDLGKNVPCIEADPSHVEQIVMNLVINAGEAIPTKTDGQIEISTSAYEVTPEVARRHSLPADAPMGTYARLEVRDNGSGMDDATLSRIFDPFFSTKFTGRGLGLAAVHGIVRTNRGFIDVHSSVGGGSTFRVLLPACGKEQPAEAEQPAAQQEVRGSTTILVVDDEEMVRKLACVSLRRRGYEVLEAKDGRDALDVLASAQSFPAVTLLDLAMPVMGGDELVPILREKYPDLRIIISSGYPEEETRSSFPPGAVTAFLQKPYTVGTLAEKVAEALGDAVPSSQLEIPKTN